MKVEFSNHEFSYFFTILIIKMGNQCTSGNNDPYSDIVMSEKFYIG